MKQQTSELIDTRTKVAHIAGLLGLAKHTSRHMISDGTYVYFFRKPTEFSLVRADSYMKAKLQADPSFPFVSVQQPTDDTVTLQLDPRDLYQRKIKPAKAAEVRKVPLSELFGKKYEAPKPVQRFYRVITLEQGVRVYYLVTAANIDTVTAGFVSNVEPRIISLIEINATDFVMFSLTGHYEVVDLWNKQD